MYSMNIEMEHTMTNAADITVPALPADLVPMFVDSFEPRDYSKIIMDFVDETGSDLAVRVLRKVLAAPGDLVDIRDNGWECVGRRKVGERKPSAAGYGGTPYMHTQYSRTVDVYVGVAGVDHMVCIRLSCYRYGKGGRVRIPNTDRDAAAIGRKMDRGYYNEDPDATNLAAAAALRVEW